MSDIFVLSNLKTKTFSNKYMEMSFVSSRIISKSIYLYGPMPTKTQPCYVLEKIPCFVLLCQFAVDATVVVWKIPKYRHGYYEGAKYFDL